MATRGSAKAHEVPPDPDPADTPSESDDAAAGDTGGSGSRESGGDLQAHLDELEDLVRENPLVAVGVAAGVGLLVGLLLSRR